MSLEDLDRLLAMRADDEALRLCLSEPVDPATLKQLALDRGLTILDEDILAAQHRADQARTAADLQTRHGSDARRLRNFINS